MSKKALSPEALKKQNEKRLKEIEKWEKEQAKPKKKFYFAYLVLIISLIYATDEIASQIGMLMKTEIANDLLANFGKSSVGVLDIISALVVPFQALGLIYRPLADRWGRKKFLLINTFGMSFALLVIYLSNNVLMYFVGAILVQFFIPHDMHVVYIMESSPHRHRARVYSSIKFFANMGVLVIPILRRLLMANASEWRNVYLIPAIIGIVTSLVALLSARETDAFIDSRLAHLRKTPEDLRLEKERKAVENAQGGLIPALKFALKHKQLRWLYITSAMTNLGFIGTINYQVIMTYGYAQNEMGTGFFADVSSEVLNSVSLGPITAALFMFPIGSAVAQVVMGFISDSKGRKASAITMAAICLTGFIGFTIGANLNWNPYVVGALCGMFIGGFYSTNDVLIMMIGESSPTNLRSSCMSAQFIVTGVGVVISYIVGLPLMTILGNQVTGIVSFCLLVPGFIAALITLYKRTHDTRGIDLDTVTGAEWD